MRTFDIPLLSSFYKTISHDPLSFVDVACLIIAIPASIILKLVSSTSAGLVGCHADPLTLIVASACAFISGLVDAACDAADDNPPTSAASMLDVLFPCLSMMFNVDNDNWGDGAYIFYFFCQCMGRAISGSVAFYYTRGVSSHGEANPNGPNTEEMPNSNEFNSMYPTTTALKLALSGVMAKFDPDTFLGKQNYSLGSVICGDTPDLEKPLGLAGQGISVGFNVAESYP